MKKTFLFVDILKAIILFYSTGVSASVPHKTVTSSVNKPVEMVGKKNVEEKFIANLMAKMTLEEKIGQLSQYVGREFLTGPKSGELSDSLLERGMVGSILNVGGVVNLRNIQEENMQKSRLKIPILFAFDVIHGFKTIYPTPLAESCSWDLDLMYRTAKSAAIEASASGIQWTFAPMVDIARDARWGRIVEGAGEDTYLGCKIAEARVKGFQWNLWHPNALIACAKHFAAYGAPQAGRDYAPVDMSNATLAEVYLPPFKACVDAGVQTFMASFNDINGIPATGNKWLLTELLRNRWHFKGFVVSDWNGVIQLKTQAVVEDENDAAALALNSGLDMDMTDGLFNACLANAVQNGSVSVSTIDVAVKRVLSIKYRLGLFDNPYRFFNTERERKVVKNAERMQIAKEAALKSIVLLKNENKTLPLSKSVKKIALIGPLADNQSEVMGSWKACGDEKDVISVYCGLKSKLGTGIKILCVQGCDFSDRSKQGFAEAMKVAQESDIVIAVLGEKALMSGESRSRAFLSLPGVQQQLLDTLKTTGKPIVTVLMNGRPLVLSEVEKASDAILETWFLGTLAGNAIADILVGDYNPSGKLTTSFPRAEGQIPNYYNYKRSGRPGNMEKTSTMRHIDLRNENLYPFGYGLSYTQYRYDNFVCPKTFDDKGKLPVSVNITNTGEYDGEETVQLYVSDLVATMVRPEKELKQFKKVFIPRGQTVRVDIELDARELGYWTNDMEYKLEPGDFAVMIGPNSRDLLCKNVTLKTIPVDLPNKQ
ncbi:glycoside hydrolase family 3 N-terminal domain-containing protein [Prevotella sp. KH2C16]|uniref:glycoside hydrolase family 3 N-terminal domain-containing protein n=1 Tax=Prevotella sp. KH2C16 TaxID=1855325 RepID=UPI000B857E97|nr:glycoside hydrolase family 3 N-terminal domain-containing protein [Prevotella sp. KH2C16]